jgi:hypothetical protein
MSYASHQFAVLCVLTLPVLVGCTADLSKLQPPNPSDAARGPDLSSYDVTVDSAESTASDARTAGFDGAPFIVDSASSETAPAQVDSGFPDGSADRSSDDVAEITVDLPPESTSDSAGDSAGASSVDSAGDSAGDSSVVSSVDSALDVPGDFPSRDTLAEAISCPTTILGSLNSGDSVQIGRLSRIPSPSTCGSTKAQPGNEADPTNLHLYDVYHFVNPSSSPVCFNFTLNFQGVQLFAAAYSSFDRTNITVNFLGDTGDVLTPPLGMGISVSAKSAVDVVVSAVATSASPAASYTLSCSMQ